MRYPNQKEVVIMKSELQNEFMSCNRDVFFEAMKNLKSEGSFKVYCYLISNKPGYKFELSAVAVQEATGIGKTAYHNAINLLVEKGYLVQPDENVNNWVFYDVSPQCELNSPQSNIPQCELNNPIPHNELISPQCELSYIEKRTNLYRNPIEKLDNKYINNIDSTSSMSGGNSVEDATTTIEAAEDNVVEEVQKKEEKVELPKEFESKHGMFSSLEEIVGEYKHGFPIEGLINLFPDMVMYAEAFIEYANAA